jgi:hypothetical protein
MSNKADQLISRLSPRLGADIHNEVRLAFGIVNTVRESVARIVADKRFSAEGHKDQIRQALAKGPLAHLDQIRSKIAGPIEALKAERAKFVIDPDRADTFAEMQRQEARAWLRQLPDGERLRVALESTETVIKEAIAMAPAQLSGLPADVKQTVFDGLLTERYGVKLENNTHLLEAYGEALIAVEEAGHDLRREVNLSPQDFAALRTAA